MSMSAMEEEEEEDEEEEVPVFVVEEWRWRGVRTGKEGGREGGKGRSGFGIQGFTHNNAQWMCVSIRRRRKGKEGRQTVWW